MADGKTGIVLEGGGMRGMYTCGILDVLMENRIYLDGMVGVSAGIAFGCNYKSRQKGRALRYNVRFAHDKRYSGLMSLLKTGNYYNAYYQNITGNNYEAERICKEIIDYNPRFSLAYMFLSTVYTLQKRYDEAENIVLSLVDYDIYDEQAARQLVRVYNAQQKDISEAELSYYDYASKSYERRGKKELAEKYRKLYEETKTRSK